MRVDAVPTDDLNAAALRGEASVVSLLAPLDGWSTPLDDTPDAVFAGRMLGDGVAIDPTGSTLHAPCAGEIIALPASRHAVTLRAPNGAEVLMHVGIDTVGLNGEGFEALVKVGDRVQAGTPLLRFDLDALARRAPSLLTPVIVVNAGYTVASLAVNTAVRAGEPLLRLTRLASTGAKTASGPLTSATSVSSGASDSPPAVVRRTVVRLEHGLHARPAARIAEATRASGATALLSTGTREADALSVTALMMLGVRPGDEVTIQARGATATAAAESIAAVLAGEGEAPSAVCARPPGVSPAASALPAATEPGTIAGVVASRGFAVGVVHHLRETTFDVPERGGGLAHEAAAFQHALQVVRGDLAAAASATDATRRDIAAAHAMLLDDPALLRAAERAIEHGSSAGHAWRSAVRDQSEALERLDDPYLRERAADLRDLEAQLLTALGLRPASGPDPLPERAIVIAREILPSQFAALDAGRLAGLCMAGGGPTSHVAIMANSIGLPMLVAGGPAVEAVPEARTVILDAHAGRLHVTPDARQLAEAEHTIARDRERREAERIAAQREARTADGRRVHVFANLGSPADTTAAVALGAEGCGLLRTEFLFLDRRTPPTEDEQLATYQRIAAGLDGRPLTIRTLDIGGDKPIDYLPLPAEDNPALGLRGVRTSLWRPELLQQQLRAILRVRPAGQSRILLPMITDAGEIETVRAELASAMSALGIERAPALGVMIETPAAAVLADTLAPQVDFFSVGTNDLTQYALAMDRGHPELAPRLDGLHPAVLRLVATAAQAARAHGREIAVCGNLGSDLQAVPLLIGLGIDELSVAHAAVPAVKARIAALEFDACRALATRALECSTADQVRALVSA